MLHALDWLVIATYAVVVLAIGAWVSRSRGEEEDLFLGGRRIPAWAAFCSMVATELSAATFIAVPSTGFQSDWAYMQYAIGSCLARFVLATTFLALYHRRGLTTVYGFLQQRFGPNAHRTSALFFLFGRILASGARLFIAALAFNVATGLSIQASILVAGLLALAYTWMGGIRAVIYTDTLQGAVFLVAVLASLTVLHVRGDGLWADLSWASEQGKTLFLHLDPGEGKSWLSALFGNGSFLPAAIIGGFFLTMATHGTDQDMVQRLLTTKDGRGGGRALIASGLTLFPVNIIFLGLGTAIWVALTKEPPEYDAGDIKRIYPIWVIHEMPTLLRGLIFAGLFAAAMSSLDSALNSLATAWVIDIRRIPPEQSRARTRAMRMATLVFGVLLLASALFCVEWQAAQGANSQITLIDFALGSMTVFYGALLGAFSLGYFFPGRGTDRSVFVALLAGAGVGVALNFQGAWLDEPLFAWGWNIPLAAGVTMLVGATQSAPAGEKP